MIFSIYVSKQWMYKAWFVSYIHTSTGTKNDSLKFRLQHPYTQVFKYYIK